MWKRCGLAIKSIRNSRSGWASRRGGRKNPDAKLTPFKIMAGKQPYDCENNDAMYINLFGPQECWKTDDWNPSITNGMETVNLPDSGKYELFESRMVWKVTHMENALTCDDCHGAKSSLDWKASATKVIRRQRKNSDAQRFHNLCRTVIIPCSRRNKC